MILLYDSVIRVSELLSLDISSVNLNAEVPYPRIYGKDDKERIVAITERAVRHLKNYLNLYHPTIIPGLPLIYVIIKGRKDGMSVGNVERITKEYVFQVQSQQRPDFPEHCYPHTLHRTHATNLYQNGTELEFVSRILRYSSTETTRIYAAPSIEMIQKTVETGSLSTDEEPLWPDNEEKMAYICGLG